MNIKKLKIYNFSLTLFQKNVFAMFKGTFVAQILGVIGGLFIANIYGPKSYGIYGVFLSMASIITVVNTLQLEYAIVLTPKKQDKKQIVNLLIFISTIITLLSLLLLFFFKQSTNFSINENLFVGIIAAFLLSLVKIFEFSLISKDHFKVISFSKILTTLFTISFQILFFYISLKKGLIYGYLISIFLVSIYFFKKNGEKINFINFKKKIELIKDYHSLVKYAFPSNLINTIANNIMPILIMMFFSNSESASYFLSIKILGAPFILISNAISKPYFQKATELYKNKDYHLLKFTKKVVTNSTIIMVLFIILLNIFIKYFLSYFFDDKWTYLMDYSLILSFLFIAKSIFSPISYIVEIMDKNHIGLLFNCYLITVNIIAIYLAIRQNDSLSGIIFLSFINGLGYIFMYFYFLKQIKKQTSINEFK